MTRLFAMRSFDAGVSGSVGRRVAVISVVRILAREGAQRAEFEDAAKQGPDECCVGCENGSA